MLLLSVCLTDSNWRASPPTIPTSGESNRVEHSIGLHRWAMSPFWLALVVVILGALAVDRASAQTLPVREIPSPRVDGEPIWCVDMTGRISGEGLDYINQLCEEVHQKVNKELCVVVVHSTGQQEVRAYGADLFNHWEVGKWGFGSSFRNDGIMLIAALDDRRAGIVLGVGIEDDRKVLTAQQIIDTVVVANFAAGDPNSALYEGIRACATRLLGIADLDSPVVLPSMTPEGRRARVDVRPQQQRGLWTWLPWILGLFGIGGVLSLVGLTFYLVNRKKVCPKCSLEMIRLEEEEDDQYLKPGEILEERLGSVNYVVWCCLPCNEVIKIRYGRFFTRYSKCPKCWYVTVLSVRTTVQHATYQRTGKLRINEDCKNCGFHHEQYYTIPKKVKIQTSGGSGGFGGGGRRGWGGGGGGGGRSSGFGGGRSSGRGASGGW